MRTIAAESIINKLTKSYNKINILNHNDDEITIDAEESPEDRDGFPIFNYWNEDYTENYYIFGVRKHLHNFLERNGWYAEWVNSYTIALYKF